MDVLTKNLVYTHAQLLRANIPDSQMQEESKKTSMLARCLEEQGRFMAFKQDDKKFFTKAASNLYKERVSPDENICCSENGEVVTMRLRGFPSGSKLPDLFEGDIFTLAGRDYQILELYWGYKSWVKREVLRASESRAGPRSQADTVAFVVCSFK